MQKFEYITVEIQPIIKKAGILKVREWDAGNTSLQLNYYGELGWELVSIYTIDATTGAGSGGGTYKTYAAFKRTIQ